MCFLTDCVRLVVLGSIGGGRHAGPVAASRGTAEPSSHQPGVLTGSVGGNFGPFPRSSTYSLKYAAGDAPFNHRDSLASSDVFPVDVTETRHSVPLNRDSTMSSSSSEFDYDQKVDPDATLLWSKDNVENDDYLHNPDPDIERLLDQQWQRWSIRGWLNVGLLAALITVLIGLFGG